MLSNAVWEQVLNNRLATAFRRVLMDTVKEPAFLSHYYTSQQTLRWNAIVAWAIGMVVAFLAMRDRGEKDWIKYVLGVFGVLSLLFCLLRQ
jgi:hypothetical protein